MISLHFRSVFILFILTTLWLCLIYPPSSRGDSYVRPTTFSVRSAESQGDTRYDYDFEVIQLALEKTRPTHGSYALINSPAMNFSRAIHIAKKNQLPNFIVKLSYTPDKYEDLVFAEFPVDLGIVGYRVCFTNSSALRKLSTNRSMEKLKQLTFGVGSGWAESSIFKFNQLRVMEIPLYESMFSMLSDESYDLFCRGANEIFNEWQTYRPLGNFKLERSIGFYYPLPRFFYTHKSNQEAIHRLEHGLKLAFEDGSLTKLWRNHYDESIKFSNLKSRQIIQLENPNVAKLSNEYKKYLFNPLAP